MEDPNLRLRQTGSLDLEYLKSVPGLLKVAEIVGILLMCFSPFHSYMTCKSNALMLQVHVC